MTREDTDILNYKLDITDSETDSLVAWLKSLGLNIQTEFGDLTVKAEDVEVCPTSAPYSNVMYGQIVDRR